MIEAYDYFYKKHHFIWEKQLGIKKIIGMKRQDYAGKVGA